MAVQRQRNGDVERQGAAEPALHRQRNGDAEQQRIEEQRLSRVCGERLQGLRDHKLSMQQVADALGIRSHDLYSSWEKGDALPKATYLYKLATYYNTTVDYLLGLTDDKRKPASSGKQANRYRILAEEVFQLILQGKTWDAPEVAARLNQVPRFPGESDEEYHERVLTDVLYPPVDGLPDLERYRTPEALAVQEEVERLFWVRTERPRRKVSMYVLDLERVPSDRLKCLVLGMQGAELIKAYYNDRERRAGFSLAIADGWMVQNVLMAPNLVRGDLADVPIYPLTLGRSRFELSVATTIINHFRFIHQGYGIPPVNLVGDGQLLALRNALINVKLAFMGIGIVRPERKKSLFSTLLAENSLSPSELERQQVIGDVLFHFIREKTEPRLTWQVYAPEGKTIAVDISSSTGDEKKIMAFDLGVLEEIVGKIGTQVVVVVKDVSRVHILRAALEMQWANSVICTLDVAEKLRNDLRERP